MAMVAVAVSRLLLSMIYPFLRDATRRAGFFVASFDDTDIVTDIELQNGETIDNNVDGTISLNPTTLTLSGTTTLTASSLATLTTAATLSISGDVTVSGGDLTGSGSESIDISEATANAFTFLSFGCHVCI